ncbi:hypothetical protein MRX96_046662 [Rhipicephalus microplus]
MTRGLFWRVNYCRNIVVVNATAKEDLEELRVISELQDIPVIAKKPTGRWTSTGYLHGVGGDLEVETLMPVPPVHGSCSVCHQGGPHGHSAVRIPCCPRRPDAVTHARPCRDRPGPKRSSVGSAACSAISRKVAAGLKTASAAVGPTLGCKTAHRHGRGVSTVAAFTLPTRRSAPGGRNSGRWPPSWRPPPTVSSRVVAVAMRQEAMEVCTYSKCCKGAQPSWPPCSCTAQPPQVTRTPDGPMPPLHLATSGAAAWPHLLQTLRLQPSCHACCPGCPACCYCPPHPAQNEPDDSPPPSALEVHFGVARPFSDDDEKMDSSSSRKRQRDQANSDDEDAPPKQLVKCPATAAPSSESAVYSPSHGLKSPEATERAGLGDDPATAASPTET